MKILITGGLGYIGGRLAQHLGEVYGNENITLFARSNKHIPPWAQNNEITVGDVLDTRSLKEACHNINAVVHLAALNEIDSAKDPLAAIRVNGEGTLNLINAATSKGVEQIIYFSTFHVYGLNASGTINEQTLPLPVHPYAITHHVSEDLVRMANNKNDINGTIVRLSNGFGCPTHPQVNRWTLVVNDLCLQAVLKNKMVLKTSGKQQRDFITLTDTSRGVEHLLSIDERDYNDNNGSHHNIDKDMKDDPRTYNLGGDRSMSILNMAKLIQSRCEKTMGHYPEIVVEEDTPGNGKEIPLKYDISKIKKTGFKLTSNINEEIDRTIAFCEQHKDLLKWNLK